MHAAGDNGTWMSRKFLYAMFHYPFVVCERAEILVTIAADNFRSMKLCRHIGFEVVYRIRNGWRPGTDLVIMRMPRSACRWLPKEVELQAA